MPAAHRRRCRGLACAWLITSAGVGLLAPASSAAPPPIGGVFQLAVPSACFSASGGGGCTPVSPSQTLGGSEDVAVSGDGAFVYAASEGGGIARFRRTASSGALAAAGQFTGSKGSYNDLVPSVDGRNLYATSPDNGNGAGGLSSFLRDPTTGEIGLLECESGTAPKPDPGCSSAVGDGLTGANRLAASSDGSAVYVTASDFGATGGALTVHFRATVTGEAIEAQCLPATNTGAGTLCGPGTPAIAQAAGIGAVTVTPDGGSVYIASSYGGGSITGLNRIMSGIAQGAINPSSPVINCINNAGISAAGCSASASAVSGATFSLASSPDSRDIYLAAFGAGLSSYRRDPTTGVITFNQCITHAAVTGCMQVPALDNSDARDVAVSPDGRFVYVTAGNFVNGALIAFRRDAATGLLTTITCVAAVAAGGCSGGAGMVNTTGVAVSSGDGRSVYTAAFDGGGGSNLGAVAAFAVELGPTCSPAKTTVAEGRSTALSLFCVDVDGDPLTLRVASGAAHGSLGPINATTATVLYTPARQFVGSDAVSFTASDATTTSAAAVDTVNVTARCIVPRLRGVTLIRATRRLRQARCALGRVTKPRAKKGKPVPRLVVVAQSPRPGANVPVATRVSIRLGPAPKRRH